MFRWIGKWSLVYFLSSPLAPAQEKQEDYFPATKIQWELDLRIEAIPIYASEPEKIFSELFSVARHHGRPVAGVTEASVEIRGLEWIAATDCDEPDENGAIYCHVTDGTPRFQWSDLLTGGTALTPKTDGKVRVKAMGTYQGQPVVRPRVSIVVKIGWPVRGVNSLPPQWRTAIVEAIYLILGHEKLHVDNFLTHLPEVASAILSPDIYEYAILPGEDAKHKLNRVAHQMVTHKINKILFDEEESHCEKLNCIYDGKGPDCESLGNPERRKFQIGSWEIGGPDGIADAQMFVDEGSFYPGPVSPSDFKYPTNFSFVWREQ